MQIYFLYYKLKVNNSIFYSLKYIFYINTIKYSCNDQGKISPKSTNYCDPLPSCQPAQYTIREFSIIYPSYFRPKIKHTLGPDIKFEPKKKKLKSNKLSMKQKPCQYIRYSFNFIPAIKSGQCQVQSFQRDKQKDYTI